MLYDANPHQDELHRMQFTSEGIEDKPETFESRRPQKRLIAIFPEDDWCGAASPSIFEVRVSDLSLDAGPIGQRKVQRFVRFDSNGFELLAGNEAIDCAGVDEEIDGDRLPALSSGFDLQSLMSEAHSD